MNKKATLLSVLIALLIFVSWAHTPVTADLAGDAAVRLYQGPESALAPFDGSALPGRETPSGTVPALPPAVLQTIGALPERPPEPTAGLMACSQMLANTELTVVDIGGGYGTAEPWVVLNDIVYYSDVDYTSPPTSLLLVDNDAGDPSPTVDAFAQAFYMPSGLTSVLIEYNTAALNGNLNDRVYGNLYTVDADGQLDEFIVGWEVGQATNTWVGRFVQITDPTYLSLMDGQYMAIILFNLTDNVAPGEVAFFDDVTLTACYTGPGGFASLIPIAVNALPTGPVCIPPSETPPDTFDNFRGYVETGGVCNTTLSNVDRQDYYTFVPALGGTYRFDLRNLPAGSEWSVTVFIDQAPYPIASGGNCRTTQPGSADKHVLCTLVGGQPLFIKVSAGTWSGPTSPYQMAVTKP
jgi:hypothetical protein